jgi:hypothetical protein
MDKKYDIKEMVKDGKKARFVRFRKGELIYVTECGFEFPIPTNSEEIGDGVFHAEEKAMLLMRYIRKHIAAIEQESATL